jgi:hypothetical protein
MTDPTTYAKKKNNNSNNYTYRNKGTAGNRIPQTDLKHKPIWRIWNWKEKNNVTAKPEEEILPTPHSTNREEGRGEGRGEK